MALDLSSDDNISIVSDDVPSFLRTEKPTNVTTNKKNNVYYYSNQNNRIQDSEDINDVILKLGLFNDNISSSSSSNINMVSSSISTASTNDDCDSLHSNGSQGNDTVTTNYYNNITKTNSIMDKSASYTNHSKSVSVVSKISKSGKKIKQKISIDDSSLKRTTLDEWFLQRCNRYSTHLFEEEYEHDCNQINQKQMHHFTHNMQESKKDDATVVTNNTSPNNDPPSSEISTCRNLAKVLRKYDERTLNSTIISGSKISLYSSIADDETDYSRYHISSNRDEDYAKRSRNNDNMSKTSKDNTIDSNGTKVSACMVISHSSKKPNDRDNMFFTNIEVVPIFLSTDNNSYSSHFNQSNNSKYNFASFF